MNYPNGLSKALLAVGAAAVLAMATAVRASVEVGQAAPNFSLTGIDGQKHALADYRGKVVVLEWNNPECPIVRKHYDSENLPKLQHEAISDGVVWLVINSNSPGSQGADYSPAELKSWLEKHHAAPSVYLRDPDGAVGRQYGAKTTPHMFVVDASGVVAYQGAIDSIPSASKADIAKATNYVRSALSAIKAGQPVNPTATKPYGCGIKYGG
jgi:peroxiredoxin